MAEEKKGGKKYIVYISKRYNQILEEMSRKTGKSKGELISEALKFLKFWWEEFVIGDGDGGPQ